MSSRYLGVVSLERFLVVERYRESHQLASSAHPNGGQAGKPDRPRAAAPGFPAGRNASQHPALRS
jgi:hypothetical protein